MLRWKTALALSLLIPAAACQSNVHPRTSENSSPSAGLVPDDALSARARAVLHRIVDGEQSWVKIHAAEVLAAFGESEGMRRQFRSELPAIEASPWRIGAWRVLAATSPSDAERAGWIGKIEKTALDPKDPDRLRAFESLNKLRVRVGGDFLQATRRFAAEASAADRILPLWTLQLAGEPGALKQIGDALGSSDPIARQRAAYALRWLHPDDPSVRRALAAAADAEPPGSAAYPFLLSAALTLRADPERAPVWQAKLERLAVGSSADARFEASQALMPYCTVATLPLIAGILKDPDSNTRVGAAWTILYARAHGISPTP